MTFSQIPQRCFCEFQDCFYSFQNRSFVVSGNEETVTELWCASYVQIKSAATAASPHRVSEPWSSQPLAWPPRQPKVRTSCQTAYKGKLKKLNRNACLLGFGMQPCSRGLCSQPSTVLTAFCIPKGCSREVHPNKGLFLTSFLNSSIIFWPLGRGCRASGRLNCGLKNNLGRLG